MSKIAKDIKKKIKKYSKEIGKTYPDIKYKYLIEAYEGAEVKEKELYNREMDNFFRTNGLNFADNK